jgi:hypothetical protein
MCHTSTNAKAFNKSKCPYECTDVLDVCMLHGLAKTHINPTKGIPQPTL